MTRTTATHISTKPEVDSVDALSDVDTTTDPPTNNEVLKWNASQSKWVPAVYNYDFSFSIATFSDGISDIDQLIGSGVWQAIGAITFTRSEEHTSELQS